MLVQRVFLLNLGRILEGRLVVPTFITRGDTKPSCSAVFRRFVTNSLKLLINHITSWTRANQASSRFRRETDPQHHSNGDRMYTRQTWMKMARISGASRFRSPADQELILTPLKTLSSLITALKTSCSLYCLHYFVETDRNKKRKNGQPKPLLDCPSPVDTVLLNKASWQLQSTISCFPPSTTQNSNFQPSFTLQGKRKPDQAC
jgi:hypothetical protein